MTKPYPSHFPPSTKKSLPYPVCSYGTSVLFLCGFSIWHGLCSLYLLYLYALCQRAFFVQEAYTVFIRTNIPNVENVEERIFLGIQGKYA
jgi:hypothetical protein